MQKARRHPEGLRPLVGIRFQVLFTPFLRVLFTFPSQYWFTIGLLVVFSLTRWCWHVLTKFHRLRHTLTHYNQLRLQDFHLLRSRFPIVFYSLRYNFWAPPLSLATTHGITIVFFSSRYLDVSVPRVSSHQVGTWSSTMWVAPFGHLRIKDCLHLPVAFRSLPRPSQSPKAQASPVRPYLLPILNFSCSTLFLSLSNLSMNFFFLFQYQVFLLFIEQNFYLFINYSQISLIIFYFFIVSFLSLPSSIRQDFLLLIP